MIRMKTGIIATSLCLATAGVQADTLDMVRSSISAAIPMESSEDDAGTYWDFGVAANFLDDVDIKNVAIGNNPFVIQDGKITYHTGINFEAAFGIPISRSLAIEISTGLAYNEVDSVRGQWISDSGSVDVVTGGDGHALQIPLVAELAWTIYDNNTFRIGLHAGGGIQWTDMDVDDLHSMTGGPTRDTATLAGNGFTFRYQFGVECLFKISSNMHFGATCMYAGTTQSKHGTTTFSSTDANGQSVIATEDFRTRSLQNLVLGINLRIEF